MLYLIESGLELKPYSKRTCVTTVNLMIVWFVDIFKFCWQVSDFGDTIRSWFKSCSKTLPTKMVKSVIEMDCQHFLSPTSMESLMRHIPVLWIFYFIRVKCSNLKFCLKSLFQDWQDDTIRILVPFIIRHSKTWFLLWKNYPRKYFVNYLDEW